MGKETQQLTVNILSEGTELTGDMTAGSDLRIDGAVKGNVKTTGKIVLGPTARVEGTVESPEIDIIGTLEGNIVSDGLVTLREKSVVTGKINTAFLSVESGAIFKGECNILREKTRT